MRRLSTTDPGFASAFDTLLAFEAAQDDTIVARARDIVAAVRAQGDAALLDCTARFDRWPATAATLEVPRAACEEALRTLDGAVRAALDTAAHRIRHYHEAQRQDSWSYTDEDGNVLGQRIVPLDRVGLYVPGGTAAYPSSVLMNAIAAKVAGVGELIMVTPTPDGVLHPPVLAAAALAGVDRVFRIGGAQAIAALAHGTATVPAVDKIVGPGNAYVAAAKRLVFGQVGIDMIAGPSEILVIADGGTDPAWVAIDLLSQAEHDEIAQALLISPDAAYLARVAAAIDAALRDLPRAAIARASLERRGALIQARDLDEACALANRVAPEHLELSVADPDAWLPKIVHAGAIFIGRHSSESLGDYCIGSNHVLPTSGTARFSSPLGVYDFQKRSSLVRASPAGAAVLGPVAATLARAEGLEAHARAAEVRNQS